jgi:hypothetical protein
MSKVHLTDKWRTKILTSKLDPKALSTKLEIDY